MVRLDSAVSSSSECPDLLDLAGLDVHKYAGKGALEDLSPYLENGGIRREDFLENALEGYTINGRLVCIPKFFSFNTIAGRTKQVGAGAGWTAEDFFALVKDYPGCIGIIQYIGNDGKTLMNKFFSYYCLEKFVDWEKEECNFDSQEFYDLAEWILNHNIDGMEWEMGGYLPENVLTREEVIYDFMAYYRLVVAYGGEVTLKGYPTVEGKPLHRAAVKDCVSILSHSKNKDGAWTFLEYYLAVEGEGYYKNTFSTRMDLLQMQIEEAACPNQVEGGEMKSKGIIWVDDTQVPYYFVPQEQIDITLDAIRNIDFRPLSEQEKTVINIVTEELEYYINDVKTLKEVVQIIQNRVSLVVQTGW